MITVRIDDHLRINKDDLPPGHEAAIKERLTIPNGIKQAAVKRGDWGAHLLPDSIWLYREFPPYLVLPRGYATELAAGLEFSGHQARWDDQTSEAPLPFDQLVDSGPDLRDDQERACQAILQTKHGVLQAPTSAGKTVVVLEAWRRSGLHGLILVEKAGLAKQWRERAREHLGIETGMIGEGEWDEKPLTIAIMQTLHRREIGADWWRRFGFTAADEAHHLIAETYNSVISRVCSRYLIGVTATPLEGEWTQPILTNTLGPIFHITSTEELRRIGLRVAPMVRRVYTGWSWRRQGNDARLVDTKVIYRRIINELREDQDRVQKIAQTIMSQPIECAQLVVAKQLGYLDLIESALVTAGYEGSIYMMRGSESGDERVRIAEAAAAGRCVILATVADEGLDIPRLDRLHLTWPQRNARVITQQIGRILRSHPDKRGSVIYDYVDSEGMLASQAHARLQVYLQAGYAVEQERSMQGSLTR